MLNMNHGRPILAEGNMFSHKEKYYYTLNLKLWQLFLNKDKMTFVNCDQ